MAKRADMVRKVSRMMARGLADRDIFAELRKFSSALVAGYISEARSGAPEKFQEPQERENIRTVTIRTNFGGTDQRDGAVRISLPREPWEPRV